MAKKLKKSYKFAFRSALLITIILALSLSLFLLYLKQFQDNLSERLGGQMQGQRIAAKTPIGKYVANMESEFHGPVLTEARPTGS